jgi:hypothetical protein
MTRRKIHVECLVDWFLKGQTPSPTKAKCKFVDTLANSGNKRLISFYWILSTTDFIIEDSNAAF